MSELLASRAARRSLVIAYVVLLAAIPVVGWLAGRLWPVLLLLIPWAVGQVLLSASAGFVFDKRERALSQRQTRIRQQFIRNPYSAYMVGACLGLVGGIVVLGSLDMEDGTMLGMLLLVQGTLFGLPSMLVAWRRPISTD